MSEYVSGVYSLYEEHNMNMHMYMHMYMCMYMSYGVCRLLHSVHVLDVHTAQ